MPACGGWDCYRERKTRRAGGVVRKESNEGETGSPTTRIKEGILMKQTLRMILEQIESDMFTHDELITIINAIKNRVGEEYSEIDGPNHRLVVNLDVVISGWEDSILKKVYTSWVNQCLEA